MKNPAFAFIVILFPLITLGQNPTDLLTFGVIADCQYCDCPSTTQRFYRNSKAKLAACIEELNRHELAFTVHLGDYIDKNYASFDTLQPIIDELQSPVRQVLGNHDFSVAESLKRKVPKRMGLSRRYYSFRLQGWRFIALDGNDLSTFASFSSKKKSEAAHLLSSIQKTGKENAKTWNGGLSSQQLNWLERQLKKADRKGEKVILFCHFPLYPINAHNLWNDEAVMAILEQHDSVKAYFNGHNHAGHYGEQSNIHYLTFKGMVDTAEQTSFSIITLGVDEISIKGYGRQEDMVLSFK